MPREYPRTVRVAEQLRQELSQLIREEVSDPRLGPVTVTSVQVARDFSTLRRHRQMDRCANHLQHGPW